jgi:hypothetical protein
LISINAEIGVKDEFVRNCLSGSKNSMPNMRTGLPSVVLVIMALGPFGTALAQVSPYAGQETREIKALSAQEVDDLLNARGMALAKAAKLNGYPGPLHSLEMADKLGLSPDQLRAINDIKAREEADARPLGAEIVAIERELDQAFANRTIDPAKLKALTGKLGELQGRLRALHLAAHLETTSIFNTQQIARYNELRGYGGSAATPAHDPSLHNR